jgi:surface protein
MFSRCTSLIYIPQLDTSSVTNANGMFNECASLTTIPLINTSSVTDMGNMFSGCTSLTTIPQLDTSKVKNVSSMFSGCTSLTTIPQLDTSKVVDVGGMFSRCTSLTTIPELDFGSVKRYSANTYSDSPFSGSYLNLTTLGGFKNLKSSFKSNFLENMPNLTNDSLMNVINNLYDWKTNPEGLDPYDYQTDEQQVLKFGLTNLAKLTSSQITIATNKGWTLT